MKFGAVAPGETAADDFEHLLDACESFAVRSGLETLAAGVNAGRLDAYRRLLARGFRAEQIGVSMWLHPNAPNFDTPEPRWIVFQTKYIACRSSSPDGLAESALAQACQ